MYIDLKKISKERFKECGWEYINGNSFGDMTFGKNINGIYVTIALYVDFHDKQVNDLNHCCLESRLLNPDDLVAIANEVKRLEEN